jgi:hypothetical protein
MNSRSGKMDPPGICRSRVTSLTKQDHPEAQACYNTRSVPLLHCYASRIPPSWGCLHIRGLQGSGSGVQLSYCVLREGS